MPIHIHCLLSFSCSFESPFYTLDTCPLSDVGLINIPFHSVGCLFTFLVFDTRKFFEVIKLMKSSLSISSSVPYVLGVISKKPISDTRS